MQIETTLKFHLTSIRWTVIKESHAKKFWDECGGIGTLIHCW
jgi:hypothetical protein